VAGAYTVVIGAPDLLPALKQRTTTGSDEILAFSDTDALRALEVITECRPRMVALERMFAATPRGAALINRIRADPALADAEIRVLSHEGDYTRVLPRAAVAASAGKAVVGAAVSPAAAQAPALDHRGTRRAARCRMAPGLEALVDGNPAALIDLSIAGAQVVSATILRPNQRVRITLADDTGTLRFSAAVAWAAFELPPKSGPQYRAGLEFVDGDPMALDTYCMRHRADSRQN
jgi:hypothetical protein